MYFLELPYEIGTILERNDKPNTLAEIRQYRVTNENILVGLSSRVGDINPDTEVEITVDELKSDWKKTNQIVLKGSIGTVLDLGKEFDNWAKKLTLFK